MEVFRTTGGVDKLCVLGTSERSCVRGAAVRRGPGSRCQVAGNRIAAWPADDMNGRSAEIWAIVKQSGRGLTH